MPTYTLSQSTLWLDDRPLLTQVGSQAALLPDPLGNGVFLRFSADTPASRLIFPAGQVARLQRFTACHRYEPFWMVPAAGGPGERLPAETQSLLALLEDDTCLLLIPLVEEPLRACLQGSLNQPDQIELVADSGDPKTTAQAITGLFAAWGQDAYDLVRRGAESVSAWLKTGRLRREKQLPDFMQYFGWCTWDAFYQEVTHENVRQGLQSFAEGGVQPRFIILDDGWQSESTLPGGERRLTAFAANAKFPGDLGPTVRMAKEEFSIRRFLVWHAFNGYWGGVDGGSLPGYGVSDAWRAYAPEIIDYAPSVAFYWGTKVGLVPPESIDRFFQDYHRHLRQQGVDGVKVDNQAALEGLGAGCGGRVTLMRRYREALEGSAQVHFRGTLINCMSNANEMHYGTLNSQLVRTSTDFWPNRPETHGLHLYTNAQVGVWFGEFIHPDWDMFQSGHAMGAFHAAGRAVSGAPVYVSDKPETHDFALLRKLVLTDGSVLLAQGPGRPTLDCLFHDPTREDVLLKIFNHNLQAGVIGVFNARSGSQAPTLRGEVRPADIPGLDGQEFAIYAHNAAELRLLGRDEAWPVSLPPLGFEVFTIVPIRDGVAPIGLPDLFNSAGAVLTKGQPCPSQYLLTLQGGGRFLAYCQPPPSWLEANGQAVEFIYDEDTCILQAALPEIPGPLEVQIIFET